MMEEGVGSSSQLRNEGQICEMPFPGFCLHQEFVSVFVMSFSLAPEQVVPYCHKCDKLNPELYQIDCCYCAGAEAFWEEKKKKKGKRGIYVLNSKSCAQSSVILVLAGCMCKKHPGMQMKTLVRMLNACQQGKDWPPTQQTNSFAFPSNWQQCPWSVELQMRNMGLITLL